MDRATSEQKSQASKFRRSHMGDMSRNEGTAVDKRSTSLYSSVRVNKGGFSRISKGTSVMTPFTNVGGEPSRYGGRNRTLKQWYEGKAFNPGSKNMGYALNKRELGMNATEIYSQFSKQGHEELFENMRRSTNLSQAAEESEMLESLKNNQFLPEVTFEQFLQKKVQRGKRTLFSNKPTSEHARQYMKEYI